jgi:predicted Rossmann fold flavoprotein
MTTDYDMAILGAGAAGMMCAGVAGQMGQRVLILDHAKAPGEKIRISGGGRCNFTNIHAGPHAFLSQNPHFCKSALSRYTQYDFIDLVERYGIPYHEKTLGQLFCDRSAKDIIQMLLDEMAAGGVELRLQTSLEAIEKPPTGKAFSLTLSDSAKPVTAQRFVIASGGKSIPKMGATDMAYRLARQFGHEITETRAGLVPFTFGDELGARFKALAGLSTPAEISTGDGAFTEALLFTHRGLSGPAVLQASSYWREGQAISLNLAPGEDVLAALKDRRQSAPKQRPASVLTERLPARLAADISAHVIPESQTGLPLAEVPDTTLEALAEAVEAWRLTPSGTEGYRTAEVTLGGVSTDKLSSKTMESRLCPGLYIIGEAVDVTGWLGGYNFQWAWASGWACGAAA